MIHRWLLSLLGIVCSCAALADAAVASVSVLPHAPWDGRVDLDVALTGAESGAEYLASFALVTVDGYELPFELSDAEPVLAGNGSHRFVWDAAKSFPNRRFRDVAVKVTVEKFDGGQALYLVFDLSGGKTAENYPHRYTRQAPDVSSDICRTTELWLKRVPAGTFMSGNPECVAPNESTLDYMYEPYHEVRLSKPYYLGIFEVTQQQYFLMEGEWPSFFTADRGTRPVEQVALITFRGNAYQNGWYGDGTVLGDSPLKRLREKTGFATLDLPSVAQWERAYRAGLQNKYWLPDLTDQNVVEYARNSSNVTVKRDDTTAETAAELGGTAKVGSFSPNPWGFYDMGGNVFELSTSGYPYAKNLLPVFADYAGAPYVDPLGPTAEWCERTGKKLTEATGATLCGGSWKVGTSAMTAYYRNPIARSANGCVSDGGIRLCITCK